MEMGSASNNPTFTDIDAADQWLIALQQSVDYSLANHGNKVVTEADKNDLASLMVKWNTFRNSVKGLTTFWLSKDQKQTFQSLMKEAKTWHKRFDGKGLTIIPVPYALEIVTLVRSMPKQLTAAQMIPKLAAVAKCGEKLLDASTPWYGWKVNSDTKGLSDSIDSAKAMAIILARSKNSDMKYFPGDPIYDEFVRRLTKVWIEAAGLYGIEQVERSNLASLKDDLKKGTSDTASNIVWLLLAGGVGYLGLKWMVARPGTVAVAVPDAIQEDPSSPHLEG
jgi:hypothetical protein